MRTVSKYNQIGKYLFLKSWQGFVPAWRAHPRSLCAYYQCPKPRDPEGGRWCKEHGDQYYREAVEADPSKKVIAFVRPTDS